MVDHGSPIVTAPVIGWWDAGKVETLLETNGHLIENGRGGVDPSAVVEGAEIVEPVRIEAGVTVRGGRIGPHVTLEEGTTAEGCELANSGVGPGATLTSSRLTDSIIGARARISDVSGSLSVTDDSLVAGSA